MAYGLQLINNAGEEIIGETTMPVKIIKSFHSADLVVGAPNVLGGVIINPVTYASTPGNPDRHGDTTLHIVGYKITDPIFSDTAKNFFIIITDYNSTYPPNPASLYISGNDCYVDMPPTTNFGVGERFNANVAIGVI